MKRRMWRFVLSVKKRISLHWTLEGTMHILYRITETEQKPLETRHKPIRHSEWFFFLLIIQKAKFQKNVHPSPQYLCPQNDMKTCNAARMLCNSKSACYVLLRVRRSKWRTLSASTLSSWMRHGPHSTWRSTRTPSSSMKHVSPIFNA